MAVVPVTFVLAVVVAVVVAALIVAVTLLVRAVLVRTADGARRAADDGADGCAGAGVAAADVIADDRARDGADAAIAEARAQGDLSENAEYEAAKDRQGFIEGRIMEVEGKLSAAQIIDPSQLDAGGRVVFGATVELEDEDSGDTVKYQIVGEDEADLKHGLINVSSPIARALIGKEEGDTAEVQAPGGLRRYEVVTVSYL